MPPMGSPSMYAGRLYRQTKSIQTPRSTVQHGPKARHEPKCWEFFSSFITWCFLFVGALLPFRLQHWHLYSPRFILRRFRLKCSIIQYMRVCFQYMHGKRESEAMRCMGICRKSGKGLHVDKVSPRIGCGQQNLARPAGKKSNIYGRKEINAVHGGEFGSQCDPRRF